MPVSKKFVVKKDAETDVITYMEYEKLKGFNVKPKKNFNFDDMINVDEMVIINPSLIGKLVHKKCNRTFEKILKMISVLYESEDDSDDSNFMLILDEMERFKTLIMGKYKDYMDSKESHLLLKKLEILKNEVEVRRKIAFDRRDTFDNQIEKRGKSSR